MILSCNSCEKKFVVPDNAISVTGRLVQCSSCGNKWTQFPIKKELKEQDKTPRKNLPFKKTQTSTKKVNKKIKKRSGPNLYSPEYLAKKHGIIIHENTTSRNNRNANDLKTNLGFYSFLLVSIVLIIAGLRILYFIQDIVVQKFPSSKIYIDYLFESLNNIKEIIYSFLISY